MTIGERIATIRKDSGLSQSDFAEELSISQSHISNIEKDKKGLSISLQKLICYTFNVNENWLLTGEGEKYNLSMKDRDNAIAAYFDKSDRTAGEKIDAIDVAAELYSVYPEISLSCESVKQFLSLFNNSEFCAMFNIIVLAYRHQDELLEGKEIYEFIKTAIHLAEKQVIIPIDKEVQEISLEKFKKQPLTKYLADLKKGLSLETLF